MLEINDQTLPILVHRTSRSRVRRAGRNATRLHNSAISLFVSRNSQRQEAIDWIKFPYSNASNKGMVDVVLRNNHNRNGLAYKVKTTSNDLIRIRPARGFLSPESEVYIRLICTSISTLITSMKNGNNYLLVVSAIYVYGDIRDAMDAWKQAEIVKPPIWKRTFTAGVIAEKEIDHTGTESSRTDDATIVMKKETNETVTKL